MFHNDLREVVRVGSLLILGSLVVSGQSKRIAVYDFDYRAVRQDVSGVYGNDKNIGSQLASRVISKLVGKGTFEVIDRNEIERVLKEQNQKFSDRFDPHDAPKLGKLLNVDAIITGAVDSLSDEVQNNRFGVGPVGVGKAQAVAEITVSVRVISTQTGQIFMAEQVTKKEKHEIGKGAKIGNSAGGDGGSSSQHPGAMAANLAIQSAADEIAAKVLQNAERLPARGAAPAVTAKPEPPAATAGGSTGSAPPTDSSAIVVGRVDAGKVYLTAGENGGVKLNDQFEVRRVTGTMKDPAGNSIETDERIETIVVTDVQDKFAVARALTGTTAAKVGDHVKKTRAPAATPPKRSPATPANGAVPPPVPRKQ